MRHYSYDNLRWGRALNPNTFKEDDGWVIDITEGHINTEELETLKTTIFLSSKLDDYLGFNPTLSSSLPVMEFGGYTGEGVGFTNLWKEAGQKMHELGIEWFPVSGSMIIGPRQTNKPRRTHNFKFRVNDPQLALQFKLSWN